MCQDGRFCLLSRVSGGWWESWWALEGVRRRSVGELGTASNLLWHLQCHSVSKPDANEALGLNPIINSFPGTYTWVYTPDRAQGATQNMRLKPSPVILELVTLLSKVQCLPRSVMATHLSSTFPHVNLARVGEFLSQLTGIEFLLVADKSNCDIDASMPKFDGDVCDPIGSQAPTPYAAIRRRNVFSVPPAGERTMPSDHRI